MKSESWSLAIRIAVDIQQSKTVVASRPLSFAAMELGRIRETNKSKTLRSFFQRVETWELLLIVYALEGDGAYGIEDYLDRLQTLKFTRLTMRNFIKDRIGEGTFSAVHGEKKSRKSLILSDALRADLEAYFAMLETLKQDSTNADEVKIDTAFSAINHATGDA